MSELIPGPVVLFNDNTVVSSDMIVGPTSITQVSKGVAILFNDNDVVDSDMIVGPTSITQVSKGIAVRFTAGGAVAEEPGAVIPTQTWIG